MKRKICLLALIALLTGCSAMPSKEGGVTGATGTIYQEDSNSYNSIDEMPFVDTKTNSSSFISLSMSTASYSDVRNRILNDKSITKDMVKIEEMVNYFKYDYDLPEENKPLSLNAAIMDTPWNEDSKLMLVGMKSENLFLNSAPQNIVLLIDVSGSMFGPSRLELVKESLSLLVDELSETDTISIVTYASGVKVVLDGVSGDNKIKIKTAIGNLKASGATAGASAIEKAYELAFKYDTEINSSSIIIATDGDFNVGISNKDHLKALLSENNRKGVSLSAVGVGFGNYKNDMLESLADAGNGRHVYLSDINDGYKFFVEELGAILNIVANDAKAQITFNPNIIAEYRIIGYENRQLTVDEYYDDNVQAGAIGSGLCITAMYEIILKKTAAIENYAELSIRYRLPNTEEIIEDTLRITDLHFNPEIETKTIIKYSDRMFIASVIEMGLLLRNSSHKSNASYRQAYDRIAKLDLSNDVYKSDFLLLIEKLK